MLINFRKKGYSGIIPFVYEGKEIPKYMQHEVSMTVCMGRHQIKEKYQNGFHLKTTSQNH